MVLFIAWLHAVKNRAQSLRQVVALGVILCGAVAGAAAAESHAYAGAWRGYKKTGGTGVGAATLISPSWAITAKHVASKKAKTPDKVNVIISFGGGKGKENRQVKKAYLCPDADIALVQLARPITNHAPAALCKTRLNKKHGRFRFTFVSRGNGLKVVPNRWGKGNGERIYHSKDANGQRPGKAGDSGGGWVFEQDSPKPDVLFAVIHGGGFGPQPSANRKWIDKTMANSGEKATWLAKPKKKKPAPTVDIKLKDTGIVIQFTGTLQTATKPTGPWQDNKAKSPLAVPPKLRGKFFRSR
ncbi:MAG TPA: trypsin-like serine protease [Verrucomicrobia bacterium]|nr:trypsin-like serine protease [Verrucomicrobiota bacterium]